MCSAPLTFHFCVSEYLREVTPLEKPPLPTPNSSLEELT